MNVDGLAPLTTEVSRPYREALAREEIAFQQCLSCQRYVFYPRRHCPHCGGRRLEWRRVEAVATLYTWSIAEIPVSAAYTHLRKPVLAVAELHGVHLPTTLVDTPRKLIRIGMPLEPVFDRATYPGFTLLRFRGSPL
jgi:uncharacterized OB-fold protein